jgi:hypothetical protein
VDNGDRTPTTTKEAAEDQRHNSSTRDQISANAKIFGTSALEGRKVKVSD